MRNVLPWIKSNPVTVGSAVVALLAIIFILYVQSKGGQLEADMSQLSTTIHSINDYQSQAVQVPPEKADDPPRTLRGVVINPTAIADLANKYKKMSAQHDQLFQMVTSVNKRNHNVLVPNLFPTTNVAKVRFDARNAYKAAFADMLKASGDPQLPHLNSGMALSSQELDAVVKQVDAQIKNENFNLQSRTSSNGNGSYNPSMMQQSTSDIKRILGRKQAALIQAISGRAQGISIYANAKALADLTSRSGRSVSLYSPYSVDAWAYSGVQPTMEQLWEGQLELWIQQDVTAAIIAANKTVNPSNDEPHNPIKRLIHMQVVPGYVGLHTRGMVPIAPSEQAVQNADNMQTRRATQINYYSGMGVRGGNTADAAIGGLGGLQAFFGVTGNGSYGNTKNARQLPNGGYPTPQASTHNPNQPVPSDFYVSTTGRVSNAVYDVRQVKVSLIINYSELPAIINAFSHVNFMTVLQCNIHEVNPYAALAHGFDYGQGDIVRADMIVETLWFRNWTEGLMPPSVLKYVGDARN